MIEHTYIELLGLRLADPITFISDIMMAAVSFYCGHRLFHDYKSTYTKFAAFFFLFLGCASFMGGSSHLFDLYLGKTPHLIAWLTQGISILFIELAAIRLLPKSKFRNLLRALVYTFFGVFVSQLLFLQSFNVVKVNSSIGLIGFLVGIHIVKYFETKDKTYLKVPLAISFFVLPAIVHGTGLSVNPWVNHNVISHVILLPCYFYLYEGIAAVSKHAKRGIQQVSQPLPPVEKQTTLEN